MKKKVIYLCLFVLSIISVFAEPVFISNQEEFQPGETLIGKILVESGTFEKQISRNQIKFYEGRRETLFDYDIFLYNDTYYFYAYLNKAGNFSLNISNILYKDAEGILKSHNIKKSLNIHPNFEIKNNISISQILSIRPGVLFTSKKPEVILENKGNSPMNITHSINKKNSEKITLYPNRPEKIILEVNDSFSYFLISSYSDFEVPIIYTGQLKSNIFNKKTNLGLNKYSFQIKTLVSEPNIQSLILFNLNESNITKIKISNLLDVVKISPFLDKIGPKESQEINLTFFSKTQGHFTDNITISFIEEGINGEIIVPLEVYIFSENTSIENINLSSSSSNSLSCADKGASFCEGFCSGRDDYASDGYCCYGECTEKDPSEKPGKNINWIFGLVIILTIVIGAYFLYKRSKSIKTKSPLEKIEEKTKSFEKRVSGNISRT